MDKRSLRAYFGYHQDGALIRKHYVNRWKAGLIVFGSLRSDGYRAVLFGGSVELIHRMIYVWHYGKIKGEIDHKNGDRSDNRIENLRAATRSQNISNLTKPPKNKTGVKGLIRCKKHWVGIVSFAHKPNYVRGKNKRAVIKKLKDLRGKLHGNFARH